MSMPVIKPNLDLGEGLSKKLDEAREDEASDGKLIPLEDAAYCDSKENNEYWKDAGESEAAKDFQEYAKSVRCQKLPVIQREAKIRANDLGGCPFGLPIPYACNNAGDTIDQLTPLHTVEPSERAKFAKFNKRVYVYNQTGERCRYADNLIENSDRVNCDYGDTGAGERDFPQTPNPSYPRAFVGMGQYQLYAYPLNSYSDIGGAKDMFAGAYSVYAHTDEVQFCKKSDTTDES